MKHLTSTERKELFILKSKDYSLRAIATSMNRNVSTVSREINRNKMKKSGRYNPKKAQHKSYVRWRDRKFKFKKIRKHCELEDFIHRKIQLGWSPEQISGVWNKSSHNVTISPLTIYKYIYSVFGCKLTGCLYSKRQRRKKRKPKAKRQLIPNRIWIDDRPEDVDKRERFGDYEGDLIVSIKTDLSVILTMICRSSRLLSACLLPRKKPDMVIEAMKMILEDKPLETVTMDNGIEFQKHEELNCDTYFCHPYSSWEKGQIEYANRMIRRYFPKKTRLSDITQCQLDEVVERINNTPRKCLDWRTPVEVFASASKNL